MSPGCFENLLFHRYSYIKAKAHRFLLSAPFCTIYPLARKALASGCVSKNSHRMILLTQLKITSHQRLTLFPSSCEAVLLFLLAFTLLLPNL
jgi:hypothetical protein